MGVLHRPSFEIAYSAVVALALEDSLEARCMLFARLLHTPGAALLLGRLRRLSDVPEATADILRSVVDADLEAEQAARHRGLRFHVLRAIPRLSRALTAERLDEGIAAFMMSDDLWQPGGRVMAETFCLHLSAVLDGEDRVASDVVRLSGLIAGLASGESAAPEALLAERPLIGLVVALDEGASLAALAAPAARPTLIVASRTVTGDVRLAEANVG
jgi:hypothetical protein